MIRPVTFKDGTCGHCLGEGEVHDTAKGDWLPCEHCGATGKLIEDAPAGVDGEVS